jgi:hypothetical protein
MRLIASVSEVSYFPLCKMWLFILTAHPEKTAQSKLRFPVFLFSYKEACHP